MSRNTKTVFKGFDYQNSDDFAAYLRKMSSKGWHFKEWSAGLVFEKGEPGDIEYAVEVFTGGTEYDTRPEPHTREFAEYCEAAGWKLIDAKRKFCIFKKVSPDAVPILTAEERLENTAKSIRGEIWMQVGLGAVWTFMQWSNFFGSQFPFYIFFQERLMIVVFWTVLFLAAVLRCVQFYWWRHSCRKRIERGENIYLGREKGMLSFTNGWYPVLLGLLITAWMAGLALDGEYHHVVHIGGILLAILVMGALISKFRPDSTVNQIIQLIGGIFIALVCMVTSMWLVFSENEAQISTGDIPLYYEDIGGNAGSLTDTRYEHSGSIFGSWTYCFLDYETESVYYNVYKSDYDWVLDKIWAEEATRKYNQAGTDCTAGWDALEAYRNGRGEYMVRYEDVILTFSGDEEAELSQEQIDIIRSVLLER